MDEFKKATRPKYNFAMLLTETTQILMQVWKLSGKVLAEIKPKTWMNA